MPFEDLTGREIVLKIRKLELKGVGYFAKYPLIFFPDSPVTIDLGGVADVQIGEVILPKVDIEVENFGGRQFVSFRRGREDIPSRP